MLAVRLKRNWSKGGKLSAKVLPFATQMASHGSVQKPFLDIVQHKANRRFVRTDFCPTYFLHLNLAKVLVYFKFQRYTKK